MKKTFFSIKIIAFCLLTSIAFLAKAQQKTLINNKLAIKVIGKYTGDSVILRWVPTSTTRWQEMVKAGFVVERAVLIKKDTFFTKLNFVKMSKTPIKALPLPSWEPLVKIDKRNAGIAAQALYGKDFMSGAANMSKATDMYAEQQGRWSFAMLAADQSSMVAKALGLRFSEGKLEKDKSYVYRVYSLIDKSIGQSDTTAIYIQGNDIEPLPNAPVLNSVGLEKSVFLTWETDVKYSGYFVERSEDKGKTFKPLHLNPLVNLTRDTLHESISSLTFLDSLKENYKPYMYRVVGVTSYAERGKPSENITQMGRDRTPPSAAIITEVTQVNNNAFIVNWKKEIKEADFKGFMVEKSDKYAGPFTSVQKELFPKNATQYLDKKMDFYGQNFYRVSAVDTAGNISQSFVANGVVIDTIAPNAPLGLTGTVDKKGIVKLHWHIGKEPDLKGYRVYFANADHHNFSNLTGYVLQDTVFYDTISIKTLTKEIFYKIVAVDMHSNHSDYSKAFMLKRPDVIPPVAPLFENSVVTETEVKMTWIQSASDDVVKQVLYKKLKTATKWEEITTLKPDVENYIFKGLPPKLDVEFTVVAFDEVGNRSLNAIPIIVTAYESNYKAVNFSLKANYVKEKQQVELSWTAPMDKKLDYFVISRAEGQNSITSYKSLKVGTTTFLDTNINQQSIYRYSIRAVYTDGRETEASEELNLSLK
jgi:uncharacterized protein